MQKNRDKLPKGPEINIAFIHGWGMNSGAFTQLIEELRIQLSKQIGAQRVTINIQTICLPGHGEKHHELPEPYELAEVAKSVATEIVENTVLIGWSLGGLVAQYLAAKHDPRIIGLLTIASTPKFQMDEGWPGIKPEVLLMFMAQLEQNHHKTLSRFLAIQMMGVSNAKVLIKEIAAAIEVLPAPNIKALRAGLTILQQADIRDIIKDIQVPTLRIYGRLDSLVPHNVVNQIQHLQPQSRNLTLKHASHAPFLTNANEFSKHIVDFLDSIVVSTT